MFEFMVCLFFVAMIFILAGGFIEMYRNHKKKRIKNTTIQLQISRRSSSTKTQYVVSQKGI